MTGDEAIIPAQVRAARGLLDWTQRKLCIEAGVGVAALRDFERGIPALSSKGVADIRAALEQAGVEFIPANGGGAGVRLTNDESDVSTCR